MSWIMRHPPGGEAFRRCVLLSFMFTWACHNKECSDPINEKFFDRNAYQRPRLEMLPTGSSSWRLSSAWFALEKREKTWIGAKISNPVNQNSEAFWLPQKEKTLSKVLRNHSILSHIHSSNKSWRVRWSFQFLKGPYFWRVNDHIISKVNNY